MEGVAEPEAAAAMEQFKQLWKEFTWVSQTNTPTDTPTATEACARRALTSDERKRFLEDEWPRIGARIQRLGFSMEELLEAAQDAPAVEPTQLAPTRAEGAGENHERTP